MVTSRHTPFVVYNKENKGYVVGLLSEDHLPCQGLPDIAKSRLSWAPGSRGSRFSSQSVTSHATSLSPPVHNILKDLSSAVLLLPRLAAAVRTGATIISTAQETLQVGRESSTGLSAPGGACALTSKARAISTWAWLPPSKAGAWGGNHISAAACPCLALMTAAGRTSVTLWLMAAGDNASAAAAGPVDVGRL